MADYFRARPVRIQAARWSPFTPVGNIVLCTECERPHGVTPSGDYVEEGEWVVRDQDGRLLVFGDDEFRALFEPMN